jgi:alkylation response protein AidB-like acyl-CoA dehydrogenase
VSGLRGSGSSDYVAAEVWVPAERAISTALASAHRDEPAFRFPAFGMLGTPIGAIAMGMAQASVDEVLRETRTKTPAGSRRTLAQRATVHRDVAESHTALLAARSLFYATIDEAWEAALIGPTTLDHRLRVRTATCHALNTSLATIDRMYTIMGGTSVFETSCLQQHFRDVHVASQHMMVSDSVLELAGRVMVGLDDRGIGL